MKKILFIEDESALQKTFGDVLHQEGFEVISALDGETGLQLIREKKPDLILLDLILPKLNGFDVLQKVKDEEEIKHIPVIVLTNLEELKDIQRAINLGAMAYLVKSNYSLEDIVSKVKQALEGENA